MFKFMPFQEKSRFVKANLKLLKLVINQTKLFTGEISV